MTFLNVPKCRLYYNATGVPEPWSIDAGKGTPELMVKEVTVNAPSITRYEIGGQPTGWLEFGYVEVTITKDGIARIERVQ